MEYINKEDKVKSNGRVKTLIHFIYWMLLFIRSIGECINKIVVGILVIGPYFDYYSVLTHHYSIVVIHRYFLFNNFLNNFLTSHYFLIY